MLAAFHIGESSFFFAANYLRIGLRIGPVAPQCSVGHASKCCYAVRELRQAPGPRYRCSAALLGRRQLLGRLINTHSVSNLTSTSLTLLQPHMHLL
jgi:hypothetical protein